MGECMAKASKKTIGKKIDKTIDRASRVSRKAAGIAERTAKKAGKSAERLTSKAAKTTEHMAVKTGKTIGDTATKTGHTVGHAAEGAGKTIRNEIEKTGKTVGDVAKGTGKAVHDETSKMGRDVKSAAHTKLAKPTKEGTYKCQICGKEEKDPVMATTHMLDHGSSALESVSSMIKEQKEGRVSKEDRARKRQMVADEEA